MAKVKRIKKRYTFLSLLLVCSIVLIFNLILSSSSKTDIIKTNVLKNDAVKQLKSTEEDILTSVNKELEFGVVEPVVKPDSPTKPDFIIKHGSITNKPIYCELRDHKISPAEILKLSEDFKKVFDFRKAKKGDKYDLFFSSDKQLQKIVYKRDLLTQYVATKNDNHGFDVVKKEIVLTKQVVVK